jgi:hypothetical protein
MRCPFHGIEKSMKIVDDEGIKESFPVYSCSLCASELMEEIRFFQRRIAGAFDPQEIELRRAS